MEMHSSGTKRDIVWLAMACFLEGIEPAMLGLSSRMMLEADAAIAKLKGESETVAYYRCLEELSKLGAER